MIALTCPACQHTYETGAREVTRCPACHRSQRIPARLREQQRTAVKLTASTQVSEPRVANRTVSEPVRKPPFAAERPAPVLVAAEPDPADDTTFASKVYDAITRTVYGRRPQQITSSLAVIAEATRIVKGIQRTDEPSLRWKVTLAPGGKQRLELWSDPGDDRLGEGVVAVVTPEGIQEIPPPVVVPFIADAVQEFKPKLVAAARSIRSGKRGKVRSCDYCGAIPPYTTPALYKVESPAMNAPRILCTVHATSELSIPDATAVPA